MHYPGRVIGHRSPAALTRLLLAFLLVTIGLQAVPSSRFDPEPRHGAAFSADTVEIAMASRPERAAKLTLPLPALPPFDTVALRPSGVGTLPPIVAHGHGVRRLPELAIAVLPYAPRAPPTA